MEVEIKEEERYENPSLGINGLGGWLIFVQIGIYITILMLLVELTQYNIPIFNADTWNLLTSNASSHYHPLWAPSLIFEAIYNTLFLIFSVYILFMLYKKILILPRLMIIFYSVSLFVAIIDLFLMNQIPLAKEIDDGGSLKVVFKAMIICAIWIPYFIKSKRVKNTFVK